MLKARPFAAPFPRAKIATSLLRYITWPLTFVKSTVQLSGIRTRVFCDSVGPLFFNQYPSDVGSLKSATQVGKLMAVNPSPSGTVTGSVQWASVNSGKIPVGGAFTDWLELHFRLGQAFPVTVPCAHALPPNTLFACAPSWLSRMFPDDDLMSPTIVMLLALAVTFPTAHTSPAIQSQSFSNVTVVRA